ncbi:MHS family MFS transporter [Azospirillum sp. YIM B02556]|uniref:MHS family MFS transporter n=1 Tax=Azospirillum endophyticum TaxID=2800326 RepID=A0ABS1F4V4_9PROT|nr:MFS transporter [Azospirillum endophyticum]MBK1838414.1 MHS family MFS transporter [Azospirillum endophyticum]
MSTAQDTTAEAGSRAAAPRRANVRRAVTAAVVGTVIEWFDYALYGAASGLVINRLFFPQFSELGGLLAAFATFAVGFFSRPLGGVVIAHFGDRFGRKPALVFTIASMGLATVAMGLLPTYGDIGILAPILLVVFRLLQGFGAGAEYAGAVTLVSEYAAPEHRSMLTAILQSATVVGIMLATLCFLAVSYMPEPMLMGWGWRMPFLISGVLFFVALYIRRNLDETPEYVEAMERAARERQEHKVPVGELLRHSPKELLFGFLSVTGHNANAYILSAFSLSYMTNTLGMPRVEALSAVVIAALTGVVATPVIGAIADRIGNAKVYIFGAAFTFLFAIPFFALLDTGNVVLATLAMSLGYGLGFGGLAGAQGAFLANLFPTRYRFSGIAMTREINSLLIAGPTPFIASALVAAAGGSPRYVSAYLMACCALTIVAVAVIRTRSVAR